MIDHHDNQNSHTTENRVVFHLETFHRKCFLQNSLQITNTSFKIENTVSIKLLYHFDAKKLGKSLVGEVVFKKINKRSSKILTPGLQLFVQLILLSSVVMRLHILAPRNLSTSLSPKSTWIFFFFFDNLNFLFTFTSFVHIWICRPLTSQRVRENVELNILQNFIIHPYSKLFHLPYYPILLHCWSNQKAPLMQTHFSSHLHPTTVDINTAKIHPERFANTTHISSLPLHM